MNVKQITGIYFSPTESTKRVVELIAAQIPGNREFLDLTDAVKWRPEYSFVENEVILIGVPVYGGRVPAIARERLQKLHGRNTPAVLVVTYGNRAYEDAWIELSDIVKAQGFHPVAAAAVVTEHNIIRSIAAGRPDTDDIQALEAFGKRMGELLLKAESTYQMADVTVSGHVPYREYHTIPFKIKVSGSCNQCGLCISKCPVQAISRTDPRVTDQERCISCMRCIHVCPKHARQVSPLMMFVAGRKLKKVCAARKEPEFF